MDAQQLRALQAPLKQRYRDAPETARIPARAEARLDPGTLASVVRAWGGETVAGLHPAAGGDGTKACSADMLLEALAACAGVTLGAVATALGVPLRGGKIVADGIWDARGTLGVDRAAPVGLTEITLRFELDAEADDATLDKLIAMTERYCVILQTLKSPPSLSVEQRKLGKE
ncbi:MAG: OsmC family protein [Alphaproteobacteria bacterium]